MSIPAILSFFMHLLNGMIQASPRLLSSRDPAIAAWVGAHLTGEFTSAPIDATAGALVFRDQGWRLAPPTG